MITIIIFLPILVIILLCLNLLLAPSNPDLEKISVYEAGILASGNPRGQFHISFYIVAILFLDELVSEIEFVVKMLHSFSKTRRHKLGS